MHWWTGHKPRPGETVLVLGAAGGVGLAAVEIADLLGARVIAAASSDEKLRIAMSRGAAHGINYLQGDLVEQVRALAPDGVDVIFDPVGGELFEQALRLPAWNGRVLIVGFASGRIGVCARQPDAHQRFQPARGTRRRGCTAQIRRSRNKAPGRLPHGRRPGT